MTHLGHELIFNCDKRESDRLLSTVMLKLDDVDVDVVVLAMKSTTTRTKNPTRMYN